MYTLLDSTVAPAIQKSDAEGIQIATAEAAMIAEALCRNDSLNKISVSSSNEHIQTPTIPDSTMPAESNFNLIQPAWDPIPEVQSCSLISELQTHSFNFLPICRAPFKFLDRKNVISGTNASFGQITS